MFSIVLAIIAFFMGWPFVIYPSTPAGLVELSLLIAIQTAYYAISISAIILAILSLKTREPGRNDAILALILTCVGVARPGIIFLIATFGGPEGQFLIETAIPRFSQGFGTTITIAGFGILIGFLLGIAAGIGRSFGNGFVRGVSAVYVEIVRGVPLIVQILIWRYAFAGLYTGIEMLLELVVGYPVDIPDGMIAAILAIGINSGGYQAEIIRGGVNALPVGQTEAGLSLGMGKNQVISTILLPQTLRLAIPPLINEFVIVIKDTSLALAIGILELAGIAQSLTSQFPGSVFTIYITNAIVYWIICTMVAILSRVAERRLAIAGIGVKGRKSLL
ncbi:MAG: amino acid ABC transporter permease [Candidatus Lokiarchaeota archaeon]|nr:amino acid ABC transporter permease [Candidatus Lokiarchaeota archaeon]